MTRLDDLKITLPNPLHAVPHQSGVFEHFPKVRELEKVFAALDQAANENERQRYQTNLGGYLKRMIGAYHPELPELLAVCQSQIALMSDASLEKAVHICEVAFHGHRTNEQHPELAVMLRVAFQALTFIGALLRHRLARQEVPFVEMNSRFFHFSHAALACLQQLKDRVPKGMKEKVTGNIALYLMLERLDLFSIDTATQRTLVRALVPIMSECDVYFIPAETEIDGIKGFWIDQEDRHSTDRSQLHGSLAVSASHDRLAANIMPLVRRLEQQEGRVAVGATVLPAEMKKLIRNKIRALKRTEDRSELHESARLLVQWTDVVDLRSDRGIDVMLLEADSVGFRLFVDNRDAALPDVDSFIAVNRGGQGVRRGVLIWKRVEARGVVLGGAWIEDSFEHVQLSLLGHSEMTVGLREWHALIRRIDERQVACWIGERQLQPGISMLVPFGKKKYSSTLDRIDHRGGNFCRGVLLLGDEWNEVSFELDD